MTNSSYLWEVKTFLNSTSFHGLAHCIHDAYNNFERIFWMIASAALYILGALQIMNVVSKWQDNPTRLALISATQHVNTVQFPTVTLCSEFSADRWGFARDLLNVIKYECNSDEECSTDIRAAFPHRTKGTSVTTEVVDRIFEDLAKVAENKVKGPMTDFEKSYAEEDSIFKLPLFNSVLTGNNFTDLHEILKLKLSGQRNNFGLYNEFGFANSTYSELVALARNSTFASALTPAELKHSLLTQMVVALPLPGQFGSFLANYWSPKSYPKTWFAPREEADREVLAYLAQVFAQLVGVTDFDFNPFDISAILAPVPDYFAYQKYIRQFAFTVKRLQSKYSALRGDEKQQSHNLVLNDSTAGLPQVLLIPNYFGQLLGPHLLHVMEVMYHCILRTTALDKARFLRLDRLYPNLTQALGYPTDFSPAVPFVPDWLEQTLKTRIPYTILGPHDDEPGYRFLYFDNSPYPHFRADYKGVENPAKQAGIEEIRRRFQHRRMMALCRGPGKGRYCEDDFQPVLTDSGLCFNFNAIGTHAQMGSNTYLDMFRYVFEPSNDSKIIKNQNSGKAFQMYMVLDSHKSKVRGADKGMFRLAINKLTDSFAVRDTAIDIEVGTYHRVRVQPTQYIVSSAVQNMAVDSRKCRFLDENPKKDSLFKFYTQRSCVFECRLQHSVQECGCTPWDYPQYTRGSIDVICDGPGTLCFEGAMGADLDCPCLPDCEEVRFTTNVNNIKMNYKDECEAFGDAVDGSSIKNRRDVESGPSGDETSIRKIIGQKLRHMDGEEFLFWSKRVTTENSSFFNDILMRNVFHQYVSPELLTKMCMDWLENDMSVVSIEVQRPRMEVYRREKAFDFVTVIGTMGGTLGLFTGASLLSLIEIFFLLYRTGLFGISEIWASKNVKQLFGRVRQGVSGKQ